MEINIPEVHAEVSEAFAHYEKALTTNDVETLDALFWNSEHVIRYGGGENLYGYAEIAAFRASRPSVGLERVLERPVITTFGRDMATACTMFRRTPGKIGRQSQTWARLPEGWRVVAAHVSVIDEPKA
ncbi:oxalurate catabolism protein HpxZ [Acetobacteraceae bacterium H6797]|nr:oxalurate catabolism protein HpxZ [Acetobacteraceae bacterium H6797]